MRVSHIQSFYEVVSLAEKTTYYLIDFENVGVDGLKRLENLDENDRVYLFSTRRSEKMTTAFVAMLMKKNVSVCEVPEGNQSVDKHLVSFLGYLIGKAESPAEFIIISKDTGYENICLFWKQRGKVSVKCREMLVPEQKPKNVIKETVTANKAKTSLTTGKTEQEKRKHQIMCYFGKAFKEKKYQKHRDAIVNAVLKGKTKTQVNTLLGQALHDNSEVKIIYERIKPLIAELPGQ